MKKVLVCALAALFLMATCLTAFAVDYTTTTTYNTNGALEIKTTVSGAVAGDMYTYLAYTDAEPTDETIIYIDQQTAAEGTPLTFSFSSSNADTIEKLKSVTVKSGSSAADATTVDESADLKDAYREVTVEVAYPDKDAVTDTVYLAEEYAVGNGERVELTDIIIEEGYSWNSATLNANIIIDDATRKVSVKDSAGLEAGTITITLTKDVVIPVPSVDTSVTTGGRYVGFHGGQKAEKLTVFGQISNIPEGKEFGIILHDDNSGEGYKTSTRKYPAKHKNDLGQFAVQLVNIIEDGGTPELMEDLYAWIYVVDANGETIYSPVNADTFITPAAN